MKPLEILLLVTMTITLAYHSTLEAAEEPMGKRSVRNVYSHSLDRVITFNKGLDTMFRRQKNSYTYDIHGNCIIDKAYHWDNASPSFEFLFMTMYRHG